MGEQRMQCLLLGRTFKKANDYLTMIQRLLESEEGRALSFTDHDILSALYYDLLEALQRIGG